LPDVIEIMRRQSQRVSAVMTPDFEETMGINDRVALSHAEMIMKRRINEYHMRQGVTIMDPENTYIGPEAAIEQDVVIYPGSLITGETMIQSDAVIGPHTELHHCAVGRDTHIKQSTASFSTIGDRVQIGPFAHIRPETHIKNEAKIGNFVEIKKAS